MPRRAAADPTMAAWPRFDPPEPACVERGVFETSVHTSPTTADQKTRCPVVRQIGKHATRCALLAGHEDEQDHF